MKIKDVGKLKPVDRFLYWIKERHAIYLKRKAGRPKPWTDDEVLQSYFFTNPYRENDKTTVWFRKNVREPLRDSSDVLMATIIFRWFNLIETGEILRNYGRETEGCADLLTKWNRKRVLQELGRKRDEGHKIFTGAFIISSPPGKRKLEAICDHIEDVWKDRKDLTDWFSTRLDLGQSYGPTLQEAHNVLTNYDGLGGFMAYEIVCDLRYVCLPENATDKMTWCNPGPGCIRGLYRMVGEEIKNKSNATSPPRPKDWMTRMRKLLNLTQSKLPKMPTFEMREIEHSLCEWDKYERARLQDGRLKRKFQGAK